MIGFSKDEIGITLYKLASLYPNTFLDSVEITFGLKKAKTKEDIFVENLDMSDYRGQAGDLISAFTYYTDPVSLKNAMNTFLEYVIKSVEKRSDLSLDPTKVLRTLSASLLKELGTDSENHDRRKKFVEYLGEYIREHHLTPENKTSSTNYYQRLYTRCANIRKELLKHA